KEAVSGTGAIDSDANSSFKIKKYVAPAVGKIAFTATDDTIKMDSDDTSVDQTDNTYVLTLTNGTVKDGDMKANIDITGLPAGLDYT
ncbi:hypothetical protein, partial [Clostridioides sp. ZZV14-6048]|uniref:hypothetical protein n=1 Tax=Clostridioides sp. ZZV14-6048 TaxID=2811490 RepID=UPI001D12BD80|nr:hypothetical protein [Clostridioides sp. ZZV14-6048]